LFSLKYQFFVLLAAIHRAPVAQTTREHRSGLSFLS
jgi:hypothetical protein